MNQTDQTTEQAKKASSLSLNTLGALFLGCVAGFLIGWLVFSNGSDQTQADKKLSSTADSSEQTNDASASEKTSSVLHYDVSQKLGTLPWENEEVYVDYMKVHSDEAEDFLRARYKLAMKFTETHELMGNAVEGFLRTPREDFVREQNKGKEYADSWLPIGYGATITDPDVVSMMTTTLALEPDHRVLEIGTGSGYQSAILSNICNHVYSIEIIEPLQKETDALYTSLSKRYPQYENIKRKLGDGYYGWEDEAPFDRIIVTCAIDHLPPPLLRQLAPEGIMVVPLGPPGRQHIMEVKKTTDEEGNIVLKRRDVYNGMAVKFIPFRDEAGSSYSGAKADSE